MTRSEFEKKYNPFPEAGSEEVLLMLASALSDMHHEKTFFTPEEMDAKLNGMKEMIFDWVNVLRKESDETTSIADKDFLLKNGTGHPTDKVVAALDGNTTYFTSKDLKVKFRRIDGLYYDTIVAKLEE